MTDQERMDRLIKTSKKNWGRDPQVIDGVQFWMVGRNASHEFYVGKVGCAFLVYSIGESYSDADDDPGFTEHMSIYHSFSDLAEKAYLGHL